MNTKIMEYFLVFFSAVAVAVTRVQAVIDISCVMDEMDALRACFDPLKDALNKATPADINEFLCGKEQKERLECIIKKFNMCPAYKDQSFLDELKHSSSGFHAKELFYVKNADSYCKCAPTLKCLAKVDTSKMSVEVKATSGAAAWNKMPDHGYICGTGKPHLECIGKSLPECDTYLQYKHNKTAGDKFFDVTDIEHAAMYAEKHCDDDKDKPGNFDCINNNKEWPHLASCAHSARLYSKDVDKSCGLRKCIEIHMETCPEKETKYFIDAVNVFGDYKVSVDPCTLTSSASSLLATLSTILLASYLTVAL